MAIRAYGSLSPETQVLVIGDAPSRAEENMGSAWSIGSDICKHLAKVGLLTNTVGTYIFNSESEISNDVLFPQKKKDITEAHQIDPFPVAGEKPLTVHSRYLSHRENFFAYLRSALKEAPNIKFIVPMGNIALYTLTGKWGIHDWRGSLLTPNLPEIPQIKEGKICILPIRPMTHLEAQPQLSLAFASDFNKLKEYQNVTNFIEALTPRYNFTLNPSFEEAIKLLENVHLQASLTKKPISIDIETRGNFIASVAFAANEIDAFCIPFARLVPSIEDEPLEETEDRVSNFSLEEEVLLIKKIRELSEDPNIRVLGHNFNFDNTVFFNTIFFTFPQIEDTMTMFHSIFSDVPKSLDILSSIFSPKYVYWKNDRSEDNWSEGESTFWNYNCLDVVRTYEVYSALKSVLQSMGMTEVYKFQKELQSQVLIVNLRGILFDSSKQVLLRREVEATTETIADRLKSILLIDGSVNFNSSDQVKSIFYEYLGQRPVKVRNGSDFSISSGDEALNVIVEREPILKGIVDLLKSYRSSKVFANTFLSSYTSPATGRMHTTFNICGTATYRFSSSKALDKTGLNFQNLPKGDEGDVEYPMPNIRSLFLPDAGHFIFDTDLDSADLRIVVAESGCKWMKEQLDAGKKPYVEIMKRYYNDDTMTKKSHPKEYTIFKSLCHGTNYLGTAPGLAKRLNLDTGEVKKIQDWYFDLNPEIKEWQSSIKKKVNKGQPISNVWGYKKYFWGGIVETTYNEAVAWIPQSTVAILINRLLVAIGKHEKRIQLLAQVHDSLVGQGLASDEDALIERIRSLSQITLPFASGEIVIPLGVQTSRENWGAVAAR